jgi:ABC-type glycerol-3-phosphate transport system substrate-binding protein
VGLGKTPAALVAVGTAAALAIVGCSSSGSSSSPASGSSATSPAPAQLTVWRMGGSVASQVIWMNGVVTQFHKDFPQYVNTKVNVVWVPWTSNTTDWNDALASGKNAPDITELGNTQTPPPRRAVHEASSAGAVPAPAAVRGGDRRPGAVAHHSDRGVL